MLKTALCVHYRMKKVMLVLVMMIVTTVVCSSAYAMMLVAINQDENAYNKEFLTNVIYKDSKDTTVYVSMPDLGLTRMDINQGYENPKTATFLMDVPQDTPAGEYIVKYVITDGDDRLVEYRFVTID